MVQIKLYNLALAMTIKQTHKQILDSQKSETLGNHRIQASIQAMEKKSLLYLKVKKSKVSYQKLGSGVCSGLKN
jgi:hypothetical protein